MATTTTCSRGRNLRPSEFPPVRPRTAPRPGAHRFRPRLEVLEQRNLMAADVILEWNEIMLDANAIDHARSSPEQGGPILTGRAFAIASAAMYDAYNSIERIGESFLVQVPFVKGASSDAAVAQAAHDTLTALFPSQKRVFDAALRETLDRVPNGLREIAGRVAGVLVARRYLNERADDGAAGLANNLYHYNGEPGFHKADPLHPDQGYYASSAMDVDPFAVRSLDQFAARRLDDASPEGRMEFMASEEYTLAYEEVLSLGGDDVTSPTERTDEQTLIGIYWAYDGRPGLGTPPRLYNQIARTVADQEQNSEAENARLFALINVAMADAGLTSWNNKYDDAFWRPIMGIRKGDVDGNPLTDAIEDWIPLGAPASNPLPGETNFTPPFPAYTSGHATFGAAAFQTLERFYGRDDISFSFVSDELNGVTIDASGEVRPTITRTFDSFSEAKLENAQSRIYLGIHWAFDRDDGIRTGDQVADYIFDRYFEPSRRGHLQPWAQMLAAKSIGDDSALRVADSDLGAAATPEASRQVRSAASTPSVPGIDCVMSKLGESGDDADDTVDGEQEQAAMPLRSKLAAVPA